MKTRCMKCKEEKEIQDAVNAKNKNGIPLVKGTCPDCGTTLCKIGATLEDEE